MAEKEIKVKLLTGRTIEQGKATNYKDSEEHTHATAICELDERDMLELGVKEGDTIEVETEHGKVYVYAKKSLHDNRGIAFIPMGIWANYLMGEDTHATGMPTLKGINAIIRPVKDKRVLSFREMLEVHYHGRGL